MSRAIDARAPAVRMQRPDAHTVLWTVHYSSRRTFASAWRPPIPVWVANPTDDVAHAHAVGRALIFFFIPTSARLHPGSTALLCVGGLHEGATHAGARTSTPAGTSYQVVCRLLPNPALPAVCRRHAACIRREVLRRAPAYCQLRLHAQRAPKAPSEAHRLPVAV